MKDLEVIKEEENQQPSELYLRAMKLRPQESAPKAEQISNLSSELDSIAQKLGFTVERLLDEAETSRTFKEEYIRALSLARQIAFLKK